MVQNKTHTSNLIAFLKKFHNCFLQASVNGRKSFQGLPELPIVFESIF